MRVAIVVAHPDDEVLGCGGCIARHKNSGDEVHVVSLTNGVSARGISDREPIARRQEAALASAAILGIDRFHFNDFPDNAMDSVPLIEVVRVVETILHRLGPQVVYTHSGADLNIDHRIAHEATLTACRPPNAPTVNTLLCFETASSTEWQSTSQYPLFVPTWFVDISSYMETKRKALMAYAIEMREPPHPRSLEAIEGLARWRGSSAGFDFAEAFQLCRQRV